MHIYKQAHLIFAVCICMPRIPVFTCRYAYVSYVIGPNFLYSSTTNAFTLASVALSCCLMLCLGRKICVNWLEIRQLTKVHINNVVWWPFPFKVHKWTQKMIQSDPNQFLNVKESSKKTKTTTTTTKKKKKKKKKKKDDSLLLKESICSPWIYFPA